MKRFLHSLALLTVFALFCAAGQAEIIAREGKGYLENLDGQMVLHLKGTPYEMGYQHGVLLKDHVRANLLSIVDNQTDKGKSPEYQMYKMLRGGMQKRLMPHIPERYLEEMRGLAEGSGLEYEQILTGNLFPEAFHCSGIALMKQATHDGSLYHVRILDYMTDAGLQEHAVVMIVEPDGYNAYLNVGFAGFMGSVTGMNEKQIGIGEMGGGGQGHWDGEPMAFLIRDALERAGTLDDAMKIFRDTPRTCEYYYVISDAKIPDARGVYATPKQIHFMKPGEPYAMFDVPPAPADDSGGNKSLVKGFSIEKCDVQTTLVGEDGKPVAMINTPPDDAVIISGPDRYKSFTERLTGGDEYGKVDEKRLMELIKRPVSMKGNLHNAIMHPSTLDVWVAVAGADGEPACNMPYRHVKLVKQDAPVQTSLAK
ncbi:MAG: peptidase C45 [bacterium]|nr:peptidase C45 [bacterium]